MLKLAIYYVYISLYASLNFAIGIIIVCGFAYNPMIDLHRIADLFTGLVVLTIGIVCFAGLRMRLKPNKLNLRRRLGYILTLGLLPLLILCLVANLFITPSVNLLVASVLSFLAATLTFVLVQHRLHSPPFRSAKKR